MLTFESASVLGVANIMQKLTVRRSPPPLSSLPPVVLACSCSPRLLQNLPFQRITHDIPGSTKDYQPTKDGILVLVTGLLQIDDEERPMKFSQTFHLVKDPAGTYYVYNDIFKLIFG